MHSTGLGMLEEGQGSAECRKIGLISGSQGQDVAQCQSVQAWESFGPGQDVLGAFTAPLSLKKLLLTLRPH